MNLRDVLMAWDFDHSRSNAKVWNDAEKKWRYECRCGETFLLFADFAEHRYSTGARLLSEASA